MNNLQDFQATDSRVILSSFIECFMHSDDIMSGTRRALSLMAPYYDIAYVEGSVVVPKEHRNHLTADVKNQWFAAECTKELGEAEKASILQTLDQQDSVTLQMSLEGDHATATLRVCHGADKPAWSDQQKHELQDYLNIMMIALSKSRLINMLKKSSLIEPMTGLPNTAGFLVHASKLLSTGKLANYDAFYFNLKSFGLVNRRFGKNETDEIMLRYAEKVADFADEDEFIGRLGGDNFIALIRKEKSQDFLRFIAGVDTIGIIDGEEIPLIIQAVAGGQKLDDQVVDPEEVIGQCSMALQLAKNVEKVPYIFVTPELNSLVYQQKQIVQQFPAALANKEFKVFYQPKVDTENNSIVGAEALIRWFNGGKIIPPAEFVPIIEKDGSICQLDFYVLESVCNDIRSWLKNGIKPVRISTNFSRKNLSHPDFANKILQILEKYEVPREYIEVEITETTEESENELLINFMNQMHDEKIATAIDDFGTGYTSLNILSDFAVDVLKIDKSFIDRHTKSGKDSVVLSNVIKMAKELDMTIINEGVENWEQVDFLQGIGSTVVQGFLFDKPLPEESFRQRLRVGKYDFSSPNQM